MQPQLAVLQTVMAREHNRVASQLQTLNPTWTDENLFQEARRIVSAEIQHITYNEFLTLLIGSFTIQSVRIMCILTMFHCRTKNQR